MEFKYRASVLNELARHGVAPKNDTSAELIRELINDLYLLEIRGLKERMLAGEIAKNNYAKRVEELRRRYPVLSLPIRCWIDNG